MVVVSISMVEIVVGKSQRRDDIYCQWRDTKLGTACINIIIIFIQKKSSASHRIASHRIRGRLYHIYYMDRGAN